MNQTLKVILIVVCVVLGIALIAGLVVFVTHKTSAAVYSSRTFLKAPKGNDHLSQAYQHIDDFSRVSLDDKARVKGSLNKIYESLSKAYPSGEIPQKMLNKHEYNWEKRLPSEHFLKLNDIFQ